jgi:hypothetical protein
MKRWIARTLAPHIGPALVTLALASSPLFAVGPGNGPGGGGGGAGGGGEEPIPTPVPVTPGDVPEINPGAAVSALILLAGGTLLLTDRVRRRNSPRPDRAA